MINILIVEDQKLIREGLKALLSLEADLTITGEAENGQLALALLNQLPPDQFPQVALLDMRMPVMDGVATAAALRDRYPDIQVLVLTTFDDDELIAQAMAVGAQGYLLKDTPSEELAMAIRSVAKGYSHFGPGIVQKMMGTQSGTQPGTQPGTQSSAQLASDRSIGAVSQPPIPPEVEALTPREKEVFSCIGQGASNREIAQQLHLSEGTVKNHVTNILGRLGLRDRTQVALLAQSIQHEDPSGPIER
ncbi:MAG: two component transcriptional regulator, LuxR family [Phormidesmis priestleyi Ana]|uniref:Two component transcriptional regulator, LuxR family n=1 Tax=Phormidesmis priestleyi Ana TaxID=1666911 RepID=A0A0P8DHP5_9CYAN|nr:MAG: two component transcriptional regulator, LuxR family [Phormidesmis priestleyi Ana]